MSFISKQVGVCIYLKLFAFLQNIDIKLWSPCNSLKTLNMDVMLIPNRIFTRLIDSFVLVYRDRGYAAVISCSHGAHMSVVCLVSHGRLCLCNRRIVSSLTHCVPVPTAHNTRLHLLLCEMT